MENSGKLEVCRLVIIIITISIITVVGVNDNDYVVVVGHLYAL
jgi:hypothetical protein